MRRLRGPARLGVVVAGIAITVAPVVFHRAAAHADEPGSALGGYRVSSTAGGFEFLYNDGGEAQATFPEAQTSAAVGSGHALATVFYPGPPGEAPGATIQQFLGADLPAPVVAAAGQLNNPVKAEAYDSGPNASSFPTSGASQVFNASAHAVSGKETATGTFTGGAGMTSTAVSTTTVTAGTVTTTATGTVSDLTIAAVVHVGSVISTATATSDGKTGSGTGTTTISGFSIGGMGVNFDPKGVTLGPAHLPLSSALVNPAVKAFGITVTQLPATKTISGAHAVEHAAAVEIDFAPPQNGGNTFTMLLGGAQADALATPAFASAPPDVSPPAVIPPVATPLPETAPLTATPSPTGVNLAPTSDAGSAFAPPTTAPSGGGIVSAVPAAEDYKGIAGGLLALGVLMSVAGAFGLGKIPNDVLEEKVTASPCPLERSAL